MTLDNLIDDRLSGIVSHGCEIISDVGYMISSCCVGFSGAHRVVSAIICEEDGIDRVHMNGTMNRGVSGRVERRGYLRCSEVKRCGQSSSL